MHCANCVRLGDVSLGRGVTYLGDGAFKGCTSLTKIFIPKSVRYIHEDVFAKCTSLKEVYLEERQFLPKNSGAFVDNAPEFKIYAPKGSVDGCSFVWPDQVCWRNYRDKGIIIEYEPENK